MRSTSFRIIAATSCLLFGAAAWRVGSHSSSAHAQTVKPAVSSSAAQAQLQSASATTSKSTTLPALEPVSPASELYTAKRGEAIPTIARHFLSKTSYLNSSELADAIRAVNHIPDS